MIKLISFLLFLSLFSCSISKEYGYRESENEKYIKGKGYVLSSRENAKLKGNLNVTFYTPRNFGEDRYLSVLKGDRYDGEVKIINIEAFVVETGDSLDFFQIINEKTYIFNNLPCIKNETIKIIVHFTDVNDSDEEIQEYYLKRFFKFSVDFVRVRFAYSFMP